MTSRKNKFVSTITGVFVAFVIFTGCDPMYRMTKCPSYVVFYANLPSINLTVEPSDLRCIKLTNVSDAKSFSLWSFHSTGAEKERYVQLCQKHNDLSYNQDRSIGGTLDEESVGYNDCDFSKITVTADKDFDVAHPAGTNLSDIVRFMSWSPYKYISSGYSQYYHYDKTDVSEAFDKLMRVYINEKYFDKATEATCYPIDKPVMDLTSEDLILLGHDNPGFIGMLYFDKTPEMKGEYNITVTMNTDDDRALSDTVKMTF